jgi:hypothetical protein
MPGRAVVAEMPAVPAAGGRRMDAAVKPWVDLWDYLGKCTLLRNLLCGKRGQDS